MSLTSFLDECPDVRARLLAQFKKPEFRVNAELLAPPRTAAYGLAGTAFDYLLRFYLQKLNPRSKAVGPWIAEIGCAMLGNGSDHARAVDLILKNAKHWHSEFLHSRRKLPSPELIKAAVQLAYLDAIYRVRIFDEHMFLPFPPKLIADLEAMLDLVPAQEFRAKQRCLLNPHFGTASQLVGGADADLLIDDTLIDIKCGKHLTLDREIFNQLLGYYLLSCIGGVHGCRSRANIKYLAVYYARYGLLHRMRVADFIVQDELPQALR
jgi:hypothetical protein